MGDNGVMWGKTALCHAEVVNGFSGLPTSIFSPIIDCIVAAT